VRKLVRADRDQIGATEQDVGRLMNGVGEHQRAHRRVTDRCELIFDGRVARDLGHAHEAEERQHQLAQLLDLAVGEDRRPPGVDPRSKIVGDQAEDVSGQRCRRLAIGDRLVVGDQHHDLDAEVLEPNTVGERSEQMTDVKRPSGTIAGQHAKAAGVTVELGLELPGSHSSNLVRSVHRRRDGQHGNLLESDLQAVTPAETRWTARRRPDAHA
jgi:hypothetical protein